MTTPDPATLRQAFTKLDEGKELTQVNVERFIAAARRWLDLIEGGNAKLPCEHGLYDSHYYLGEWSRELDQRLAHTCRGGCLLTAVP